MKGPATSHPALAAASFPRPRGGTWRSASQSIACAALFDTGLDLWLSGPQRLVLWAHVLIGLALLVMLSPSVSNVPLPSNMIPSEAFTSTVTAIAPIVMIVKLVPLATAGSVIVSAADT